MQCAQKTIIREIMKKIILIVTVTTSIAILTTCNLVAKSPKIIGANQSSENRQTEQVHPIIENIFYNLPLKKNRLELREVMVNDTRFILTDTTFNNFKASSFFKGISTDKGLIKSNPDSIQVMLIYGNATLATKKGGQKDSTKHPMILEYRYFFSNKESAELEYGRMLNLVKAVFTDTTSIMDDKWEAQLSKSTDNCIGKIFDHFDPYYRVGISYISVLPIDGSKPVFVLDLVYSTVDTLR